MSDQDRTIDDPFRLLKHSPQDGFHWTAGDARWAGDVAHRYTKGNFETILNIGIRRIGGEIRKFLAVLKRFVQPSDRGGDPVGWSHEGYLPRDILTVSDMNQAMLVSILENIENPENGRQCDVPTIVRLYTFEEFLGRLTQRFDPPTLFIEFDLGVTNWELQNLPVNGRIDASIPDGQYIREMIQGAPNVMGAISRNEGHIVKRSIAANTDPQTMSATFRIVLFPNGIRLNVTPREQFFLDSAEVFFSPSYLEPAACELRTDHTASLSK